MKNPHLWEEEAHICGRTMNFDLLHVDNAKHMIIWQWGYAWFFKEIAGGDSVIGYFNSDVNLMGAIIV